VISGRCTQCGGPLYAGDRFCGSCGARVSFECVSCGERLLPDDRFCPRCGSSAGLESWPDDTSLSTSEVDTSPWIRVIHRLRAATLGEFEIRRELGRGGMAIVFLAYDLALKRKVAIKVMSPGLLANEGMVRKFKDEAITVAHMSHPHIITIYTVRQVEDLHFFIMKFVEGRSLDHVIHDVGALPIPIVRAILFQVGSALAYAHRRRVIHRDVKPANILLDEDGNAVVTDFGIAKILDSPTHTQTGVMVGTPAYMSPEQCLGHQLSWASDQYSLGVVAYELLTGDVPFTGSGLTVLQGHIEGPAPPISVARPDCPPELEAAVMRMLEKEPSRRWPSMVQLLTAVGATPLAEDDPLRATLARLARPGASTAGFEPPRTPVLQVPTDLVPTDPIPPSPLSPSPLPTWIRQPAAPEEVRPQQSVSISTSAPFGEQFRPPSLTDQVSADRVDIDRDDTTTGVRRPAGGVSAGALRAHWWWGAAAGSIIAVVALLLLRPTPTPAPVDVVAPAQGAADSTRPASGLPADTQTAAGAVAEGSTAAKKSATEARMGDSVRVTSGTQNAASHSASASKRVSEPKAGTAPATPAASDTVRREGQPPLTGLKPVEVLLAISPSDTSLPIGDSVALRATFQGSAGARPAAEPVIWRSSDATVATVSVRGVVRGIAAGSANISASRGSRNAVARVTVLPEPVVALEIVPANPSLLVGRSITLRAGAMDRRGRPLSGRSVVWQSSDPLVAAVDPASGTVTAMKGGTASITATSEGVSSSVAVNVTEPITVASLTVAPPRQLVVGETLTLRATVEDSRENELTGEKVSWKSDDLSVARVDSVSGVVTATGAGVANITASAGGHAATVPVTVAERAPPAALPSRVAKGDSAAKRDSAAALAARAVAEERRAQTQIRAGVAEYIELLRSKQQDRVASLYRPENETDKKNQGKMLRLIRDSAAKLAVREGTIGVPRIAGAEATIDFAVALSWKTAFGASRTQSVTFRAEFEQADDDWRMTRCRVVGAPDW
jgi:eukaryotic-like serine/threonine-protein kinase